MKIHYFEDTDTALIQFTNQLVAETRELSENMYIDLDANGNPVSLTIEHTKSINGFDEIAFSLSPSKQTA